VEEEGNSDYGGMAQPSQQHVAPSVKRVEWGLGTRGLRIVAAFWSILDRRMAWSHAVEVLPSGHPFSRLIRHAGKRWAYSAPVHKGHDAEFLCRIQLFFSIL